MIMWTHGLINRLVRLGDILALGIGAAIASIAGWPDQLAVDVTQALFILVLFTIIFIRLLNAMNAYRVEHYRSIIRSCAEPAISLALSGFAIYAILAIFLPTAITPASSFLGWLGLAMGVIVLHRILARYLVALAFRRALLRRRVAIIGAADRTAEIIEGMNGAGQTNLFEVTGIYDDRGPDRRPESVAGVPVLGPIDALRDAVRDGKVDMIVVALPWSAAIRIHSMLERLQGFAADVVIPFESDDFRLNFSNVVRVAGMPSLQVAHRPLKGSQGLLKVVEDKVVATIGLIITAPILIAAAVAIRMDSPGPILFRQPRIGFNNKTFEVYKLRTMKVDPTDDGTRGTSRDDPRITKVGNFLRSSSIDELPQLLNVLRGDMSIVGPRPHVPNMLVGNHAYLEAVREYAYRCRVKPGITGWAQINGARGGLHTVEKAKKAVLFDIFYIENWSLWFDIKIMARTVLTGLFGRDVF